MTDFKPGDRVNFADNYPVTPGTITAAVEDGWHVCWDDGFMDARPANDRCSYEPNVFPTEELEPLVSPDLVRGLADMAEHGWGTQRSGSCVVVEIDGSEEDHQYEVNDDENATEAIYGAKTGHYVIDTDTLWADGPMAQTEAQRIARIPEVMQRRRTVSA